MKVLGIPTLGDALPQLLKNLFNQIKDTFINDL